MISMAISLRRSRPATRYQTDVARSWGSMALRCGITERIVNAHEIRPRLDDVYVRRQTAGR
jgi:hypothetical protein